MSAKHTVFVLAKDGTPLTPTTPAKARKLLKGGVAKPTWSKFGTFGIQLLVETRRETPQTTLGIDPGSKYEGYAVVCGNENNLAIKLNLPNKKEIARKIKKRHKLRRTRRKRKCRRRKHRYRNRKYKEGITPSQLVIVNSRLKILRELFYLYPIHIVGLEDVRFSFMKQYRNVDVTTAEVGKKKLRCFFAERGVTLHEFRGWETAAFREKYCYPKVSDKSIDAFESHCSDALALACEVGMGLKVEPGVFLVVDDSYRAVRRQLQRASPDKGGIRKPYGGGIVFGLRKGILIGSPDGDIGQLCGKYRNSYRYRNVYGKLRQTKQPAWISSQLMVRRVNMEV